ncbi:unnamed protein product [Mytilus edulis]|uniref:Uncharacterized protein n=1 Tax=Mytilus edulis TaxID=6550 RepID=A0A8S3QMS2_MYTED|nr:unnamed protein product [Mytilus edulis]
MSMEMREQILIPVLKEDCEIPEHLKPFTYIDARGPIESWLTRLVTAIESPDYRNFDTVHEERSKNGWCRELPFKLWRYIPDSLNDKAFKLNYYLYKGVLEVISKATFFKYRQCLFPWVPTLCCGSAFLALGIVFVIITCIQYAYYKNLPSDGYKRDELTRQAKKYNVTENHLIENELSFNILLMVLFGLIIVSQFAWLTCCSVHIVKKGKLMRKALMIANHSLIDHNLLVGFKHYKCSATVKDYLEQCFKKKNTDSRICEDESCTPIESTPTSTVNDLNDESIISHLENEDISDNIEENDREKARDLLIRMSVDFVQDFLEEKLDNSEYFRHTSRAICMCEYAETHGLLNVPFEESYNSERGLRNHSDESTNNFANVV